MQIKTVFLLSMGLLLAACSKQTPPTPMDHIVQESVLSYPTPAPTSTAAASLSVDSSTSVPDLPVPDAATWKSWPVIPSLSPEMLDVITRGMELGRDPHVVSVVGDCESSSDWFLKDFSKDARYYDLGPYSDLQATIDFFNPSLGYRSYAALRGATAVTVLTPLWADRQVCDSNETPLACEYRIHNPAFAIIALGTNDVNKRDKFEPKMRAIIQYTLKQGIVPILVTKADNIEGDESINLAIAGLAAEYHLPVWNFWAAVQPLPDRGLQADGVHLTFGPNYFNDPDNLYKAWPVRNLTALQILEAMRLAVPEK